MKLFLRGLLCLLLLLAGLAAPSSAAEKKKVGVLELRNEAGLPDQEADFLTEKVRIVARRNLPQDYFIIMTKENITELLPPNVNLEECVGASCEVEIGGKLGAQYLITGDITSIKGELRVVLKAYDIESSDSLSGEITEPGDISKQEEMVGQATEKLALKILDHADLPVGEALFPGAPGPGQGGGQARIRDVTPEYTPPAVAGGLAILYITSDPPGAEVHIGSVQAGATSPIFQKEMEPGVRVRVTLRLELYHDLVFDVDLKPGVLRYENLKLEPAFGTLLVESEPEGAKVLVSGREVGTTPYENTRYPSGNYLLELEKEWYLPLRNEMISVNDGETTRRKYTLQEDYGMLKVDSDPQGAEVFLDGQRLGGSPGEWRVKPRRGGKVVIQKLNYHDRQFVIDIDRGQTAVITAKEANLTARLGDLQIYCDPPEPGAKVWVDGKEIGSAPAMVEDLTAGPHVVKVESAERRGTTDVEVVEGIVTTVKVPMLSRDIFEKDVRFGLFTFVLQPGDFKTEYELRNKEDLESSGIMATPENLSAKDSDVWQSIPCVGLEIYWRYHFFTYGLAGGYRVGTSNIEDVNYSQGGHFAVLLGGEWLINEYVRLSADVQPNYFKEMFSIELDSGDTLFYERWDAGVLVRPRLTFLVGKVLYFSLDGYLDALEFPRYGLGLGAGLVWGKRAEEKAK